MEKEIKVELPEWDLDKEFDKEFLRDFGGGIVSWNENTPSHERIKLFFRHSTIQLVEKIMGEVKRLKNEYPQANYNPNLGFNQALQEVIKTIEKYAKGIL